MNKSWAKQRRGRAGARLPQRPSGHPPCPAPWHYLPYPTEVLFLLSSQPGSHDPLCPSPTFPSNPASCCSTSGPSCPSPCSPHGPVWSHSWPLRGLCPLPGAPSSQLCRTHPLLSNISLHCAPQILLVPTALCTICLTSFIHPCSQSLISSFAHTVNVPRALAMYQALCYIHFSYVISFHPFNKPRN